MVDRVVQQVAGERLDGERGAVAAAARCRCHCVAGSTRVEGVGEGLAGGRQLDATTTAGSCSVVALLDGGRVLVPVRRSAGRPRVSISRSRSSYSRYTSRTWQAYSSGDHTSRRGRLAPRRPAPSSSRASAPRSRAAAPADVARGSTSSGVEAALRARPLAAPRSSPWCPARSGLVGQVRPASACRQVGEQVVDGLDARPSSRTRSAGTSSGDPATLACVIRPRVLDQRLDAAERLAEGEQLGPARRPRAPRPRRRRTRNDTMPPKRRICLRGDLVPGVRGQPG